LAFTVEPFVPTNPVAPATLAADLDVGQAGPTTLRGPRAQPGIILTGYTGVGNPVQYEFALAPLGTVTGTTIKALVGPGWAGDLNRDGMNNQDDLNIVLSHMGQSVNPGDRSMGDADGNGFIDANDAKLVYYETWGEKGYPPGRRGDYIGIAYTLSGAGAGAGSTGIPEPTTASLAIAAVALALGFGVRRRKRFVAVAISAAIITACG